MIELSSQPKTIQSLYGWYRTGKLFVNRRYQRKLVWTLLEKQKLIDSVMNNFPVPAVILAEQPGEQDVYEVIDGLQRLHAILSFIETAFYDEQGRYFDLESFPTARSYKNDGVFIDNATSDVISTQQAARFLDYSMSAAIVRNATDDDINEIFDRINTYGHRLSNQERRQAGVASDFAKTVRQLSASLRGDVSREKLPLFEMPSISIETPTAKHGYQVKAEEVFWVRHGIVLAGDLRESQDEECVADLAASIVQGSAINRARAALDALYDESLEEGAANAAAFIKYGEDKLIDEIKYIVGEVEVLAESDEFSPLKRRLFNKVQGNAFPTIFSTLFLALHRKIVVENKRISSYRDLAKALTNLGDKLDAGKKGATVEQRKQNIDMVCGVIDPHMVVDVSVAGRIYNMCNRPKRKRDLRSWCWRGVGC